MMENFKCQILDNHVQGGTKNFKIHFGGGVNEQKNGNSLSTTFYAYPFSSMRPKRMMFILLG